MNDKHTTAQALVGKTVSGVSIERHGDEFETLKVECTDGTAIAFRTQDASSYSSWLEVEEASGN